MLVDGDYVLAADNYIQLYQVKSEKHVYMDKNRPCVSIYLHLYPLSSRSAKGWIFHWYPFRIIQYQCSRAYTI